MKTIACLLLAVPVLLIAASQPSLARDRDSKDVSKRCNQIADARDLDGHKRRDFLKDCKSSSNKDSDGLFGGLFGKDRDRDRPPTDDKTDWCMDQARQHGMRNGYAFNNYVKQCKNRN